nr:MAG TPA: hypothetical protein [Caudoviricetes sp.]
MSGTSNHNAPQQHKQKVRAAGKIPAARTRLHPIRKADSLDT